MAAGPEIPFGAASRVAGEVDSLFLFITGITVFFFVVTQGLLIYFAFKYRHKKGTPEAETPYITSNRVLEGIWVAIPTLLVMAIFAYGYKVWNDMRTPLQNAEEIQVTAQQWLFRFTYPDGREAINEVRVPVGQPVQFTMTSKDVIHAFFIPEFKVKQDILPGRYTYIWLKPDAIGTYTIYCTQYCGVGHSNMLAKLYVMNAHEYNEWYQQRAEEEVKALPLADRGKALVQNNGCLACHSTDGTFKVGPTWKDLYGSTVPLEGGGTVIADDNYIRQSILDPNAKIVKGYKPVMPTFKGILSDEDITAIIAYIKTLSEKGRAEQKAAPAAAPTAAPPAALTAQPSAEKGEHIVEEKGCIGCHSTDGTVKVGPSFKGLYGSRVTLSDGKVVVADDAYIKESIYEPNAKIVKGSSPVMPSFKGVLTDADVESVILYLKTLK